MKEICICAAMQCKNGGAIIRGHRHRDCLERIFKKGMYLDQDLYVMGFITSRNRFVDRREGFKLQKEAGVKSVSMDGYNSAGWLFSEDLY